MEFFVLKDEQKEIMASYLSEDDYTFYASNPNIFYICAEDDGNLLGYAIVHADEVAEIMDLNFIYMENPIPVIKGLLRLTTYQMFRAGASVVTMNLMSNEGRDEVEDTLQKLGFEISEISTLYTFTLGSIKNNREMQKTVDTSDIQYLSALTKMQKMEYDALLKENHLFPYFTSQGINQDLSCACITDNKISGCFLVSTEDDGIHIEYTHTDGVSVNRLAIMKMMHKTFDAVKKIYSDETEISAVTQNKKISEIIEMMSTEPVTQGFSVEYFLRK